MPETPDFDAIAREAARSMLADGGIDFVNGVATFAEQLRLVWNARGAADIAKIDATITYTQGSPEPGLVKHLDRALRSLDR